MKYKAGRVFEWHISHIKLGENRLIIFDVERGDAYRPAFNLTVFKASFALRNSYTKFRCIVTVTDTKLLLHKAFH
jgi:hypothetical protein